MKIGLKNTISFQKKLVAKAAYLERKESRPCFIYELEQYIDKDYMNTIKNRASWKKADYIASIPAYTSGVLSEPELMKMFVLENAGGCCLGYAMLDTLDNYNALAVIETVPCGSFQNKKRVKKYIGETMITFLANYALKNKKVFKVIDALDSAKAFYLQHCFLKEDTKRSLAIEPDNVEKLTTQNELHTGKNIEFLA